MNFKFVQGGWGMRKRIACYVLREERARVWTTRTVHKICNVIFGGRCKKCKNPSKSKQIKPAGEQQRLVAM